MNKYSLSALVAAGLLAGGLSAGSASAADLGGNCCADLEERIAELEATTARKGNRKVSLTVSGFVAQQILAWDDGFESNAYITDTGAVSIGTNFSFTGKATIAPGVTAGFALKIEAINNDSLLVTQNTDDPGANALGAIANGGSLSPLAIESAYWFIKSETFGRVSVGQQSTAADNAAILPDASGSLVVANYVLYDVNGFFLRNNAGGAILPGAILGAGGLTYGSIASCYPLNGGGGVSGDCDGYPSNVVRYDSPTFSGFSFSASWGEDDIWAVSARFAGEFSGVKLALATAYNENTDETLGVGGPRPRGFKGAAWQIGGYVQHVPTGLFGYAAYAQEYNRSNIVDPAVALAQRNAFNNKPEGETYYFKGGIRQKWSPFGHTVLYGEYGNDDDKFTAQAFQAGVSGSELERYGIGIVQEIDAAAMSIWLAYRHYEPEVRGAGGADLQAQDFDLVKFGALISF